MAQANVAGVAVTGPALAPSPALFTARTSKAYSVPLMRLDTVTLQLVSGADARIAAVRHIGPGLCSVDTVVPTAWRYW